MEQPNNQLQLILDEVLAAEPSVVEFRGKKRVINWLYKGTIRKFSHVSAKEKDDWKKDVKTCAIILLNNVWKIRLFYWIYWRWLYYIVDIDIVEVLRVLDGAKKKIPSTAFSLATILVTGMSDLMMTMKTKEAKVSQAGQSGEQPTH